MAIDLYSDLRSRRSRTITANHQDSRDLFASSFFPHPEKQSVGQVGGVVRYLLEITRGQQQGQVGFGASATRFQPVSNSAEDVVAVGMDKCLASQSAFGEHYVFTHQRPKSLAAKV